MTQGPDIEKTKYRGWRIARHEDGLLLDGGEAASPRWIASNKRHSMTVRAHTRRWRWPRRAGRAIERRADYPRSRHVDLLQTVGTLGERLKMVTVAQEDRTFDAQRIDFVEVILAIAADDARVA